MDFLYLIVDDLNADFNEIARLTSAGEQAIGWKDTFKVEKIRIGPGYFYESALGGALATTGVLQSVISTGESVDCIILGCATDPALDAARSLTDKYVIGGGEAAVTLSGLVGRTFGVVTILDSAVPELKSMVRRAGAESRCVGYEAIEMPFDIVHRDYPEAVERVSKRAAMLRDDGADSIVLACMSFGFTPMAADVSARIGIPVIDPLRAAVASAKAQLITGTSVSRSWVPRLEDPIPLREHLAHVAAVSLEHELTGWTPQSIGSIDLPEGASR